MAGKQHIALDDPKNTTVTNLFFDPDETITLEELSIVVGSLGLGVSITGPVSLAQKHEELGSAFRHFKVRGETKQ